MPLGASRLNFLAKLLEEPVTPGIEVTFTWDNWDGTNDGADVIAHDDTVSGDGNTRHRINMFDDTYGVISYDVGDDSTNTYWRQITLTNTSVTLGAANTVAENISASHTTAQYAVKINSTKILHGNIGSPGTNIDYIIFTLSGSTVSASSAKTITFSTGTFDQHAGIYFLDTNKFVVEGKTTCAVVTYNSGSDTITEDDVFTYGTDGGPSYSNVALYFLRLSSTQWMFAGAAGTPKVAQIYQFTGGTISTVGSSVTISSTGGNLSRHGQNTRVLEDGTTKAIIYGIPDTTNDDIDLIPVKVSGTTISVGSTVTYSTTTATGYPRVDNSVWINDTQMMGIYGVEDNNTVAVVIDYDYATNTVSIASDVIEQKINTDTGYIFQANRADRVDAERLIVAWSEAGIDTSGDLTIAVLKGNRARLTAVGNAQVDTAISKFGGASALFDGNDVVTAANPLVPATDNWTVEGWFYPTNISATDYLWAQYATSQSGRTTGYHTSSGAVGLFINGGPSIGTAAGTMSNNNWYHLAFTRSGSNFAIYVNGVSSATGTGTPSIYQGQPFVIGAQDTVGSNGFIGQIDDVRVSSTVRYTSNFTPPTAPHVNDSDTILLSHMNGTDGSTDFFDDTGVRAPVGLAAVGNAQVDTAISYFGGGSFLGDGSGDYLDTGQPLIPEYDDWTVECWFRFDNATGEEIIASQYAGGTDGRAVFLYRHSSTAKLRCFINGWSTLESSTVLTNNTWYHGAVSRDGDTLRLFLNGTLESTQTANENVMQTEDFFIGYRNGGNAIDGNIDEFRVSSVARYTASFTAPTAPHINDSDTILLAHMNGTDGSTTFRDDNS